jgi:hypothetical protein
VTAKEVRMSWTYRGYDRDSNGATAPIIKRLASWLVTVDPGGKSLGTYARRSVRGGSDPSVHQTGRAIDWAPSSRVAGDHLADVLTAYPDGAAVDLVIWQRRIWGGTHGPVWRPYSGVDPHDSHLHIESRGGA